MIDIDENKNQIIYNEMNNNDVENKIEKKSKKKIIILILVFLFLCLIGAGIYFYHVPVVMFNGSKKEVINVGQVYIEQGVQAKTFFGDASKRVIIEGKVDTSKVGEYKIKYKVPYLNKYKEYTRVVSVVDTENPVLTLNGEEHLTQIYGEEYQDPGCTAIDNYDGEISQNVNVSKVDIDNENYELHYTIEDSSGNKSEVVRYVKVIDNVAPVLTLNGNSVTCVVIGNKYNEKGATAIDNKDGDISSKVKIEGKVDTSVEGTYIINYEVTDEAGNISKEQRQVIVNSTEKAGVIYLTFDDGPSTSITPYILDILKEKGVHATFFILNYNQVTEELVKRELAEGNSVGIHGYSHDYAVAYASVDACYENIIKLQEKIKNSTGVEVKIVRFPGGSSNTISKKYCEGVMTEITKRILDEGFKYFDWNVASGDSGDVHTKEEVYSNVTSGLVQGRKNVVLMHDFGGNNKTLEALPEIIDYGLENGYLFDVITTDTPMVTHSIQN